MLNVKVHLRQITKYVLLLGIGIQSVFGLIGLILWIGNIDNLLEGGKSVICLLICGGLGYAFLRLWCGEMLKGMYAFGILGILTSPAVLQCCLQSKPTNVSGIVLILIFVCVCALWRKGKKWMTAVGALIACAAIILCSSVSASAPPFAVKMMSRFCYPDMFYGMGNFPQELVDEAGYIELREALRSVEGIEEILYPSLMERYGDAEKADAICYSLAMHGLSSSTKNVVLNIAWDFVGYNLPMVVSELQLQGMGYDAVSGYNYGQLTEKLGAFAKLYWKYSVVWNVLSLLAIGVIMVIDRGRLTRNQMLAIVFFELAVICLTMQGAGLFDYTRLPMAQFLWMGCVMNGICKKGL